ncbi:MAG TPA: hypothetical protein VGC45_06650 [Gryllotalpicola sp.]
MPPPMRLNGGVLTPAAVPLDRLIDARSPLIGGAESRTLSRRVERGELERIRPGLFREPLSPVESLDWARRAPEQRRRHLESAVAVALTRSSPVVFSHRTALAILGLPLLGPWPGAVDILEPPDSPRRSANGVRVHRLPFEAEDVIPWGEFFVTSPERTLADVARELPMIFSVPALDAGLIELDREGIRAILDRDGGIRGTARAVQAVDFADPASGSPGESGSRVVMAMLGTPRPELQLRYLSRRGRGAYLTDFEWPGLRKIGEFDGRGKYLKDELLRGRSPGQVVYEEKLREDELRAEGNDVGRWGMPAVRCPWFLRDELGRIGVPMTRGNRHLRPLW